MNRRLVTVALALAVLAATAGCLGGGVDEAALAEHATYDWNVSAAVTYNVTGTQYHAVYRITEGETVEVYRRDDIGGEQPVSISALQFRYPNGTVVNASAMDVRREGQRTHVTPPADEGLLAYTARTGPKSFGTPVLHDGSHEVVLPANMRAGIPILSTVSPGGYERRFADGRVHLVWEETPSDGIHTTYYLQRDLYLFAGLITGLVLLAGGGVVYFRLRIRELERTRRETGPDVGTARDDGPP